MKPLLDGRPVVTRTDAKVSKIALALERSPYKGTNNTIENNKGNDSGGLEDVLSGEICICIFQRNKYGMRKVYQNFRDCGVLMSAYPFPEKEFFFLNNEVILRLLAHRPLSRGENKWMTFPT